MSREPRRKLNREPLTHVNVHWDDSFLKGWNLRLYSSAPNIRHARYDLLYHNFAKDTQSLHAWSDPIDIVFSLELLANPIPYADTLLTLIKSSNRGVA